LGEYHQFLWEKNDYSRHNPVFDSWQVMKRIKFTDFLVEEILVKRKKGEQILRVFYWIF
jgi:hypothetical protein